MFVSSSQHKQEPIITYIEFILRIYRMNSMTKECRICFESDGSDNGQLIVPCKCDGTSRYIHRKCLDIPLISCVRTCVTALPCDMFPSSNVTMWNT